MIVSSPPPSPPSQERSAGAVDGLAAWKRYMIFCGVGASGLLVDMGLFHLLHTRAGWPLAMSKSLAAEVALLNNFLWNDRWTFGHRRLEPGAPWPRRLLRFHAICASGIVLTLTLLWVMHRWAGVHAELANLAAIVVVSGWNFGWSRSWGWAIERPKDPPQADSIPRP